MSIAEGGRAASPGAKMKELEAQVRTCQLCRLARTRTNAVPGEGDVRAEVMFIGEGPGYHEDKQGRPFVGAAGQFLNELLEIAGLDRSTVYIANVVKCRPPNNRDPEPDEMAACRPYLERQIALVNPKVIVTLGRFSMASFFPGERISQIHGTARVVSGRMCVAMYHPAAGLHQGSLADVIRADFRKLPVYLEQSRRIAAPRPKVVEERIEEAEDARAEVTSEPETRAVLAENAAARTINAAENVNNEEPASPTARQTEEAAVASVNTASELETASPTPAGPPAAEQSEPAAKVSGKAGKRKTPDEPGKKQDKDYQQLSFF